MGPLFFEWIVQLTRLVPRTVLYTSVKQPEKIPKIYRVTSNPQHSSTYGILPDLTSLRRAGMEAPPPFFSVFLPTYPITLPT